jgi:hypothetical protein
VLTLTTVSVIIKASKRARGGKPGRRRNIMKITLRHNESEITTTCTGTSQHIHDRRVIHGLSKRGCDWMAALPEGARAVSITKHGEKLVDYVTADPLP